MIMALGVYTQLVVWLVIKTGENSSEHSCMHLCDNVSCMHKLKQRTCQLPYNCHTRLWQSLGQEEMQPIPRQIKHHDSLV